MAERSEDDRLVRYITGQCSPLEAARIRRWIAQDPARWERFLELERTWRACGPTRQWDVDAAWAVLRRRRRLTQRAANGAGAAPGSRAAPLVLWRSGSRSRASATLATFAAALVLAVAGVFLWRGSGRRPPRDVVPLKEIATARGQQATIRLADGTRVILGPASTIRYAQRFGANARRDVYLDGQAYFEVVHDTLHPFVVHTARGVAEDLGTEFVVTAYDEMRDMQVVVASGRVALGHASGDTTAPVHATSRLTLARGELGRIDSTGALSRRDVSDTAPYFGWTTGQLVFRGVPLGDALPEINRWYDIDLMLGDRRLASRRLVAVFGRQPAPEVVRLLAMAVGARYEQRGRSIVLLPRHETR
jgi:transmembrane sensor